MQNSYLYSLPFEDKIKLIENNQYLDIFAEDPAFSIRMAILEKGYVLNKLVNDYNYFIRIGVAEKGYGLDILINDKDINVREQVIEYCKKHQDKEECKNLLNLYNL